MMVLDNRQDILSWYQSRGYVLTQETVCMCVYVVCVRARARVCGQECAICCRGARADLHVCLHAMFVCVSAWESACFLIVVVSYLLCVCLSYESQCLQ